jgi:site-specific recombinase XerC
VIRRNLALALELDVTGNLNAGQKLVGHSSITTTMSRSSWNFVTAVPV